MRKILTHLFVFACNFYMYSFIAVVLLMFSTVFYGALPFYIPIGMLIVIALGCLFYQIYRRKVSWYSFGEMLISNTNKKDVLEQNKPFLVSRIPLFILVMITLIFFANIGDGVSEGNIYRISQVIFTGLIARGVYYALSKFCNEPSWYHIAIIIMAIGILLINIQLGLPESELKTIAVNMYSGLIVIWLIVGSFYIWKEKPVLEEMN